MAGFLESSIVLVEDNQILQESILDLLYQHGYHNLVAFSDGFNALNYFKKSIPDLVILDVEMPGIDGLEILFEIKLMKPTLPVVIMSARFERQIIVKAHEFGADTFFPKPLNCDMFCSKIEALLKNINF